MNCIHNFKRQWEHVKESFFLNQNEEVCNDKNWMIKEQYTKQVFYQNSKLKSSIVLSSTLKFFDVLLIFTYFT